MKTILEWWYRLDIFSYAFYAGMGFLGVIVLFTIASQNRRRDIEVCQTLFQKSANMTESLTVVIALPRCGKAELLLGK